MMPGNGMQKYSATFRRPKGKMSPNEDNAEHRGDGTDRSALSQDVDGGLGSSPGHLLLCSRISSGAKKSAMMGCGT
jgi:hypothetical protein